MRKIALLYLFFSMNSFAQTIVSYDFNSGNQGWTLSGSSISGGRIFMNGNSNGVATSPVINLSGISQAQVSVDWNCVDESSGFESSDVIRVEYWNGSSWVVLWTRNGDQICPSDNDNQNGNTGNLLLQAGLSSTQIRLVSTTNSSSEDMFWDNVVVSQPIDPCDAVASGNLDTDGDGISDSCDLDDDNDGILDTSEGEVVCQSAAPINLAPYDNQTNTEQIFANNSITVAGIEIGLDHTAFGSGSISTDEINDGHVAGEIGVVIGHSGNVDSFNDRIESEYTFSAPVSDFQFSIHDMDAGDRMIINAYDENNTIIPITASMYTIITPSDINYLGGNQFRDVTGSSSSGLQGTVRFDYTGFSVTRLVIQYWDDESSGSYTFYPELGSGCVYDIEGDTDNDGIPDRLDLDSDNDGCFDAIEADENVTIADLNPDGSISGGVDTDGVPTLVNNSGSADIGGDQGQGAGAAQDNTDFSACCPSSVSGWADSDGDDVSDRCDLDDDNDGILDAVEGYCASSTPVLLSKTTYTATGSGVAGRPVINFSAPNTGSGKRLMILYLNIERDHTPSPYSDNWESTYLGPTLPVQFGGVSMVNGGYSQARRIGSGSATYISKSEFVYYLYDAAIPSGTNSVDLSNYNLPINAGDEWMATILVYDQVSTFEYVDYNGFSSGFPSSHSVSGNMSSPSQPAGVTQDENVLLAFMGLSSDNGVGVPSSWYIVDNTTLVNTSGTYAGSSVAVSGSSENDGITNCIAATTGLTGSQTATFSFNTSNALLGGALLFRLVGSECIVTDTDSDGIPDYLDLDSDNDGCFDAIEGDEDATVTDLNPDGSIGGSVDTDGVPVLVNASGSADIGGDQGQGIGASQDNTDFSACCPSSVSGWTDTDADGVSDRCDLDDDNDGILDTDECSNTINDMYAVVAQYMTDGTGGLQDIVPSDFGLALNVQHQNVTADLSDKFGYPANSGAIIVSIENASVHPTVDTWWTKDGELPSVWTVTGTLGAFVLMSQNDEYFGDDSKTIHIYDGSSVIPVQLASFENQVATPGTWDVIDLPYEKTLINLTSGVQTGAWRYVNMNTEPKEFGFSTTTSSGDPTYAVNMYLECDADMDGVSNRLDLDSDNDGCLDAVEGGGAFAESDLVTAGGSVTVGTGSSASNQNLCEDNSCVDANGIPTIAAGGQGIGLSQDSTQTECYCTQLGLGGTATEFTQIGVSDREAIAPGWPGTIQNGFIAIESEDSGFVITRVEQATDIVNPVEGMLIYDIADQCVKLYNGAVWKCLERSCN